MSFRRRPHSCTSRTACKLGYTALHADFRRFASSVGTTTSRSRRATAAAAAAAAARRTPSRRASARHRSRRRVRVRRPRRARRRRASSRRKTRRRHRPGCSGRTTRRPSPSLTRRRPRPSRRRRRRRLQAASASGAKRTARERRRTVSAIPAAAVEFGAALAPASRVRSLVALRGSARAFRPVLCALSAYPCLRSNVTCAALPDRHVDSCIAWAQATTAMSPGRRSILRSVARTHAAHVQRTEKLGRCERAITLVNLAARVGRQDEGFTHFWHEFATQMRLTPAARVARPVSAGARCASAATALVAASGFAI